MDRCSSARAVLVELDVHLDLGMAEQLIHVVLLEVLIDDNLDDALLGVLVDVR